MEIAVLLSSYNGRRFLPEQLESLANQTVAGNITVYIRNDGSDDDCADILAYWSNKVRIRQMSGQNLGPAQSFWKLFCDESIQADYYAFCDQDDVWDADKLERAVAALTGDKHLYCCNCRLIDAEGRLLQAYNQTGTPVITLPRLFVSGVAQGCAMVFTHALRQFIRTAAPKCIPMHDIVVMLYALGFGEIVWDEIPRFGYRVHGSNMVAKNNKSLVQKLRTVYWNWKNSSKNSMGTVAAEMLQKARGLSPEDVRYLTWMSCYRKSLSAKWKLLIYNGTRCALSREKRSYYLRILLNLL